MTQELKSSQASFAQSVACEAGTATPACFRVMGARKACDTGLSNSCNPESDDLHLGLACANTHVAEAISVRPPHETLTTGPAFPFC